MSVLQMSSPLRVAQQGEVGERLAVTPIEMFSGSEMSFFCFWSEVMTITRGPPSYKQMH